MVIYTFLCIVLLYITICLRCLKLILKKWEFKRLGYFPGQVTFQGLYGYGTVRHLIISIQHLPVVVQCTSHSRELGKRRSWSLGRLGGSTNRASPFSEFEFLIFQLCTTYKYKVQSTNYGIIRYAYKVDDT